MHVSHGQLADFSIRSRIDSKRCIFRKVRSDSEVIRFHAAFDNSHISPAGTVIFELILEPLFRLNGFGED